MKNKIKEIANEVGGTVRTDYSGRGMFGKTCMGVICEDPNECLEAAGSLGVRGGRIDNMGKQYIVYWPTIKSSEI